MNRIDRLHAILTHLQSKKRVTAQEIADRFRISLRTVYRDVKALEESGVPVIGEAGSGYSIMEGYRLPPVMFSPEEANALLLAGKLAEKMTDASVQKHFDTALFKIKAVLRSTDKDNLDQLTDHIAVMRYRPITDGQDCDQYLAVLQRSIVEKKAISIRYQSGGNEALTDRVVEPIGLWYYSQYWHLIGWCRLRNDYRDFRVNRIRRLELTDQRFPDANHPTLKSYIESLVNDTSGLQEAVIRVDKGIAKYLREPRYYYGFVREEEEADHIRMVFLTSSMQYFGRWLLMYTGGVRVESPELLKEEIRKLVQEAQQLYV